MTRQQKTENLRRRYRRYGAPGAKDPMGRRGHGPGRNMGMGPRRLPRDAGITTRCPLHHLNEDKPETVLAFFRVILNTVVAPANSYMLYLVISTFIAPLTEEPGSPARLVRALTVPMIALAMEAFANHTQVKVMLTVAQNALQKTRNDLFTRVQKLPIRFYDTNSNGDLASRFTNDVDAIEQVLSPTLVQSLSGALSTIGTLLLMPYTNLILALITLVTISVIMKAGGAAVRQSQKYLTARQTSLGAVNGYIEETITGQKVVEVFCHEDKARGEFGILNHDLRYGQVRAQLSGSIMGPMTNNPSQINYSLIAYIGGLLCVLKSSDVGGLTILLNFPRQFSCSVSEISMQVGSVFSTPAGAECVFSVMDGGPEPADITDCVVPSPTAGHVTFHHVIFGYDSGKTILKDVNLYAKPGQKITLAGSIGTGKTATTNLLNRFYDIRSGTIIVDGAGIRRISRDALRNNTAMVPRDTHLLIGTVRESTRYGRLDATDDGVVQAAKTASAHSSITRPPHGCGTTLEGDGANLGQEQRQFFNVARTAISKVPMLTLDEATSSVDTRTEKHIEHGMDRLIADRTTFIIAHRLSTMRSANATMVLECGEVIERGTHEEFLEMKGRYYELYTGMKELD